MKVWVVVLAVDMGKVVGVFSTEEKAANYVGLHGYSAFIITEYIVDAEA